MKNLLLQLRLMDPIWPFGLVLVGACIALCLALPGCAGPATAAVDAELQATAERQDEARADLAQEEPGSPRWDELLAELAALRARTLELEAERMQALGHDTRGAVESTLWSLGELIVAGGAVGFGVNRHRSKTRQRELDAVHARLEELELARQVQ